MPFSDQGEQILHIEYGEQITDKEINRRLRTIIPAGVYEGFSIEITGNQSVDVSPGVVHVEDGLGNTQRLETEATVSVTTTPSKPFIGVQWERREAEGWFGTISSFAANTGNIILLGEVTFDANDNATDIDFRNRAVPEYSEGQLITRVLELDGANVSVPTEVDDTSISIGRGGHVFEIRTDLSGGAVSVELPRGTDVRSGREIEIVDSGGNASTNNITMSAGSNDSIQGTSTLSSDYASVVYRYFASNNVWVEK